MPIIKTTSVYNKIKKTILPLIIGMIINKASAQEVRSKIGENPTMIDNSATLELDSTNKGFLPPRMTMAERNAIEKPIPTSLMVWCTDCNRAISPASGQLCVWMGTAWTSIMMNTTYKLTTDKVVMNADNSATINGTLVSILDVQPTETGVVYTEIIDNDFQTLPVLDPSGNATASDTYKVASRTAVSTVGSQISVNIFGLSTTKSYYFRTYARNSFGISYGNAFIFSLVPPAISTPVFTDMNRNSLLPTFTGKLTVNAGTQGTITEYGYCSSTSTTNNLPTIADNKVELSTPVAIAAINATLSSKSFMANPPAIDLAVNDYNVTSLNKTCFRYYVIANGQTTYSNDVVSFTPIADPITGGTAVAKLISIDPVSIMAGGFSTNNFTVFFDVIKKGSYNFVTTAPTGATTGLELNMSSKTGTFTPGEQELIFTISGFPKTSLKGNSFEVSKALTLNTGAILLDAPIEGNIPLGGNALCGPSDRTTVVPVFLPKTGRIWMDRNLGASRQAISEDDFKAYGCFYQWGRGNDGAASMNWTSATAGSFANGATDMNARSDGDSPGEKFIPVNSSPFSWRSTQNTDLWQGINGKNNPCPFGYRVPAIDELDTMGDDYADATAAFNSIFKFPLAGYINNEGTPYELSAEIVLLSSDLSNDDTSMIHYFTTSTSGEFIRSTSEGVNIRCIKN